MDLCGWAYVGPVTFLSSLNAEGQAAWVSAIGTLIAAGIAVGTYVHSIFAANKERIRLNKEAAAKVESRQKAILDTVWYDLATALGRVVDAVGGCEHHAGGPRLDPMSAFIANSFSPEQKTLSDMRELIIEIPDLLRTEISAAIGDLARYNTYLETFGAWATTENLLMYPDTKDQHLDRIRLEAIDVSKRLLLIGVAIGNALHKPQVDIDRHFNNHAPLIVRWVSENGSALDQS